MAIITEYYVNDVLQGYTPTPPDKEIKMVLDDEACLGFADVVDRTQCTFKVITELIDDTERTQIYEDYLACHPTITVLVDSSGFFLINNDNKYITKD